MLSQLVPFTGIAYLISSFVVALGAASEDKELFKGGLIVWGPCAAWTLLIIPLQIAAITVIGSLYVVYQLWSSLHENKF